MIEVIDDLLSTDTFNALSANMGRVLNESIQELATTIESFKTVIW